MIIITVSRGFLFVKYFNGLANSINFDLLFIIRFHKLILAYKFA